MNLNLLRTPSKRTVELALFVGVISLFAFLSEGFTEESKFPRFDQVAIMVAREPSRFSDLLEEGQHRVVRFALLGDSQETAPGGGGRVYMPRLNFALSEHYQNSPETLLEPIASTQFAWLQGSALLSGKVVELGKTSLPK